MPVWMVEQTVPMREIEEWLEIYSMHPFGGEWDQHALLMSEISQWTRGKRDHPKKFKPPFIEEPDPVSLQDKFHGIVKQQGGTIVKKKMKIKKGSMNNG